MGEPTPYLDQWYSLFYPTYTNPYEKAMKQKKPAVLRQTKPEAYVYASSWLDSPYLWFY